MPQKLFRALAKGTQHSTPGPGARKDAYGTNPRKKGKKNSKKPLGWLA